MKRAGLRIARRKVHAFTGPGPINAINGLLSRIPYVDELFTTYLIYEIENPGMA